MLKNKGLSRFINGDYAWAMQEAMMIAYANPNYTLAKLEVALKNEKAAFLNTIEHFSINTGSLYQSKHSRHFDWQDDRGSATPISIYHLWKTRPT